VPTISDKSKTNPGPANSPDLILQVPTEPPTTPLNTQANSSILSNLSTISKAMEALKLGTESPAKMNFD
jgi:hypothetical protein